MGHISDRTLDNLLDGSIDGATELAIEEHVRHCDRCAHRLREWELLFPQVRSLMPTGEHATATAGPSPQAAFATVRGPSVYVPDWSPPPSHHSVSSRLAWGLVILLAVAAGYVVYQKTARDNPTIGVLPETFGTAEASGDSGGLGSGIPATSSTVQVPSLDAARSHQESLLAVAQAIRDSQEARARDSAKLASPVPPREEPATSPVTVASREPVEQDVRRPPENREAPVTFPIKVDPAARQTQQNPTPRTAAPLLHQRPFLPSSSG